jgi:hypothetical protein
MLADAATVRAKAENKSLNFLHRIRLIDASPIPHVYAALTPTSMRIGKIESDPQGLIQYPDLLRGKPSNKISQD